MLTHTKISLIIDNKYKNNINILVLKLKQLLLKY